MCSSQPIIPVLTATQFEDRTINILGFLKGMENDNKSISISINKDVAEAAYKELIETNVMYDTELRQEYLDLVSVF